MTSNPDHFEGRLLHDLVDRQTTRSFKRTVNSVLLLRAVRDPSANKVPPRKVAVQATFLGLMGLLVGEHVEFLRLLINQLR